MKVILIKFSSIGVLAMLGLGMISCKPIPKRFSQLNERAITSSGIYYLPQWSPDGKYLTYIDNSEYEGNLVIYDNATRKHQKIANNVIGYHNWKPDGKITYLTHTPSLTGSFHDLHQIEKDGTDDKILLRALPEIGNYGWISENELVILLGDVHDDSIAKSLYVVNLQDGNPQHIISSQELGFDFFSRISYSESNEYVLIDGIGYINGAPGILNIFSIDSRSVVKQLVPESKFPISETAFPLPSLGDDINFGWISNTDWILLTMNTPEGDCANYSLVFVNGANEDDTFCIPSDGVFGEPTISPDLTQMAFIAVNGPISNYLILADVPPEFLDRWE